MVLAPSDERLVKLALTNNKKAWLQLVKRYEGLLYNYGLRMLGNSDDALDLMQDVYLSVFRSLSSWRQESSFKTWLMTIAHRRCVEQYRKRRDEVSDEGLEEQHSTDVWHHPEQVVARQQKGQRLLQAMQQLPMEQRVVVELKFFQHLSHKEIAEQLEISLNTAKSRFYAAIEKLQTLIEVDDDETT